MDELLLSFWRHVLNSFYSNGLCCCNAVYRFIGKVFIYHRCMGIAYFHTGDAYSKHLPIPVHTYIIMRITIATKMVKAEYLLL